MRYLFEASVGGGIPVIHPIGSCLTANDISEVDGILNGTTNYILTEMFSNGKDFDSALKEAQEKGYAERNPSADVDGIDACRKISILSAIAFGSLVPPEEIRHRGHTQCDRRGRREREENRRRDKAHRQSRKGRRQNLRLCRAHVRP